MQAICRYITEKYGCLPWAQKSVLDRALAGQWMDWYITKLHPHMTVIFWTLIRTPAEERDMKAVNEAIKQATEAWNIIDSQLKNTEYLLGSSPTLADIPAGCAVNRWYAMDIDRPSLPNLEAWHSRLKDRSAYQNHVIMPLI